MADVVWYRSLYWRIAFGFVALLAMLLGAQGVVFLWLTGRMADIFPSRTPAQFATSLASEVGAVLVEDSGADLAVYVNRTYASPYRAFAIAMADGRTVVSDRVPPPASLLRSARGRLLAERGDDDDPQRGRRAGGGGRGRGSDPRGDARGFGRLPGLRGGGGPGDAGIGGVEYARILVGGEVVGMVAVPRGAPPIWLALRALGPLLAGVAFVLLAVGTAVAALVIFRPTHRRLGQLQAAARAIGAGQVGVRAPVVGGDEVTSLSRAFNEMAEQLEARNDALESADRTRRQLLADVSHELMTPLAAIRGYVETLQMSDVRIDQASRVRYLDIVSDESERLEHIIGDLLDLARLEGGGGALRMETVPVAHLFERLHHRHEHALGGRGVELVTLQPPGAATIHADRTRIEQAVQNLVANAIRHTPSGGRVTVSFSRSGDEDVIAVEDTGSGIPAAHLPRIFDRFYKADESRTGTHLPSGSGLGLSIVQAIVRRHGGSVRATNLPGSGARFEIRIPTGGASPPSGAGAEPSIG